MKSFVSTIPGLTPLRGIAALLVAIFHFTVFCIRFVKPEQTMFIDNSYLMVDLFFIMSGFLILHVYKEEFAQKINFKAFRKFIAARFARVYPLHFIVLVLMVGLFYASRSKTSVFFDPHTIVNHIFLLQSLPTKNHGHTWNLPSWSISAEWWAYTAFPFLCFFIYKNKKIAIPVLLLGVVTSYVLLLYYVPTRDENFPLDITFGYGFLRGLAGFTTGMLLYVFYSKKSIEKLFNSDILCTIYIVLILLALHKGLSQILLIPGFAFLVLFVTCNSGKVIKAIDNKLFNFLGDISYSVYMLHFLVIIFLKKMNFMGHHYDHEIIVPFFEGVLSCLIYLLVLLVISTCSYYALEKPCRKYINSKWGSK